MKSRHGAPWLDSYGEEKAEEKTPTLASALEDSKRWFRLAWLAGWLGLAGWPGWLANDENRSCHFVL